MAATRWKVLESKLVISHPAMKVVVEKVDTGKGIIDEYYSIEGGDWNLVFPLTRDGKVVLVRQYKHGARDFVVEFPAGVGGPGEPPEETARRELEEETGYRVVGKMEEIFDAWAEPSKRRHRAHGFFARVEKTGKKNFDETEDIEVILATPKEVLKMALDGTIQTPGHIAAALMLKERKPRLFA